MASIVVGFIAEVDLVYMIMYGLSRYFHFGGATAKF